MIGTHIQSQKPDQIPKPELPPAVPTPEVKTPKSKNAGRGPRLPKPPQPLPAMAERYGLYSPLISSGTMLDSWKVGTGEKPVEGAPAGQGPQGGGKGKRKIIRIRA